MSKAQDDFLRRRYGVFNHYLYGNPSDTADVFYSRGASDWNAAVDSVDVDDLALRLHETGAGYYFITVMQGSRFMLGPNAAYDAIAGTKPGEACSRRDLIPELADALEKYDIALCLYFTGDGPHIDREIGPKFGYTDPRGQVTMDFVEKWASVLREYAVRYGDKIKAWWIDGCYEEAFGYTPQLLKPYYDACKAGNPDCLVAMNNGVFPEIRKHYPDEELTCGEFNDFEVIPESRFIDGAQTHILAPLGKGIEGNPWSRWRSLGARRDGAYMLDYVRRANAAGMPVTIDVYIDSRGNWDPEQFEVLKTIGRNL